MDQQQSLANVLKMRSWIYDFCGKAFTELPSRQSLSSGINQNVFAEMEKMDREQDGVPELARILTEMKGYNDEQWEALVKEFHQVEQIHIHANDDVDQQLVAMKKNYESWGLPPKEQKYLLGEIGQGFKFMNFLVCTAFDFLAKGNVEEVDKVLVAQQNFLSQHLSTITQLLCEQIVQEQCSEYYHGLAQFIPSYLEMEIELLNSDLDLLRAIR